jgi:peroxiredoxin Q/BCP
MNLVAGQRAPAFALVGVDKAGKEREFRLEEFFGGGGLVVYFYPKDGTPGCTNEAIAFRDRFEEFARLGIQIIGISPDSAESHARFQKKYGLPFPLLSDPNKEAARAWGAFGEKKRFGKVSEGIIRSSFLLDASGTVRSAWRNVKVEGHIEQILQAVQG